MAWHSMVKTFGVISVCGIILLNGAPVAAKKVHNPTLTPAEVLTRMFILRKYMSARYAAKIATWISASATRNDLDPNTVIAIAYIESGFYQGARGSARDMGVMQVMPFWGRSKLCKGLHLWRAQDNIECGCRILKHYIDIFNGNELAGIVAYNQGIRAVHHLLRWRRSLKKNPYARPILWVRSLIRTYETQRRILENDFGHFDCGDFFCTFVRKLSPSLDDSNTDKTSSKECDGGTDQTCPARQ